MIAGLANSLTGRPVVDETVLTGKYDFVLTFSSETAAAGRPPATDDDAVGVSLFAAFEKQLGLKLESRRIPVEEFVIDHADRNPDGN
jgi:uncharacterized protein (TIGR03435 family)